MLCDALSPVAAGSRVSHLQQWKRAVNIIFFIPITIRKNGFYHQQGNKTLDDEHLVICDPSHVENTGLYECRASNKRGQQSARAYLDVTGKTHATELLQLPLLLRKGGAP